MNNTRVKYAWDAYVGNRVRRFDRENRNLERYQNVMIASALFHTGFECDGFCPECMLIRNCEEYREHKDKWRLLYS